MTTPKIKCEAQRPDQIAPIETVQQKGRGFTAQLECGVCGRKLRAQVGPTETSRGTKYVGAVPRHNRP